VQVSFKDAIELSSLLSLFEVGVGINLALALLDSFKDFLQRTCSSLSSSVGSSIVNRFLPLLEVEKKTENLESCAKEVNNLISTAKWVENKSASDSLFKCLKLTAVLVAVFMVCALAVTPFMQCSASPCVITLLQVMILLALALLPFTAMLLLAILVSSAYFCVLVYSLILQNEYRLVIKEYKQLAERKITV
jgi:hypothetical protein